MHDRGWAAATSPDKKTPVDPDQPKDLDAQLGAAAFVCDFVRVRDLLVRGANPDVRDEQQRTPLHQAVLGNSVGLVGLLIEHGADVNARDDQGFTPLHFAAQEYAPEIARILVGKEADVNARDEDGNSVLWRAVAGARGRNDIVRLLLEKGASAEQPNLAGVTPKELALRLGSSVFTAS